MLYSVAVGAGVATGAVCTGRFDAVFFFLTVADFFVAAFRAGVDLLAAASALAVSARFIAQRRLVASLMAVRPAADILRFDLEGSGVAASAWTLDAAHLLRCASAIAFRPAALIFRRLRLAGSGVAADVACASPRTLAHRCC